MKLYIHMAVIIVAATLQTVCAVSEDFSRYQGILDRKPFGEPLPDPSQVAANAAVPEAELFTKTLKMVAIKLDQNGRIRVGFLNQAAGNKSYYIRVGEKSDDGIELVDADFELESALLKKDMQSGWIYMGSSPQKPAATPKGVAPPSPASTSSTMAKAVQQKRVSLYAELLRKRREEQQAPQQPNTADSKLTGDQLEKHLKEYQMDAIRKGMKPLPIPLTKEMDDQLVAEGVLPPMQPAQIMK
jgi:hypothetical protein